MRKMRTWMKGLLFVLAAAIMVFGVRTVTAYAAAPRSKPGNLKLTENAETNVILTWENPWGDDLVKAKNDDDVTGGIIIEKSQDGGKTWEILDAGIVSYDYGASYKCKQKATDDDLVHGKTYTYRAYYYNINRSTTSNRISKSNISIIHFYSINFL